MKTKIKCLKCKKAITGIAIRWYNDVSCLKCHNEFAKTKLGKEMIERRMNYQSK